MTPRVLFVVESDPRTSPRPAEAIRIAAGVGAWKKVEVHLYLRGPAARALGEFVDDLVEEESYLRYLPILGEWGRPVFVQQGAPELQELGSATVRYQELAEAELARLAASCQYVTRF